jgi:hypothetical protein
MNGTAIHAIRGPPEIGHRSCRCPAATTAGAVEIIPVSFPSEVASMLRVITKQMGDAFQLELHGLLGGDWVQVLEQHWRSIVRDLPSADITVMLSEVDFIDRDGERLVRRMAESGVHFRATGCMNQYVVGKLTPGTGATKGARS